MEAFRISERKSFSVKRVHVNIEEGWHGNVVTEWNRFIGDKLVRFRRVLYSDGTWFMVVTNALTNELLHIWDEEDC